MLAHGYSKAATSTCPFPSVCLFSLYSEYDWRGYIKRQGRFSASVAVSSLVRHAALGAIRSRWLRRSRTCPLQWIRMCSVARSEDASTLALVIWHAWEYGRCTGTAYAREAEALTCFVSWLMDPRMPFALLPCKLAPHATIPWASGLGLCLHRCHAGTRQPHQRPCDSP
jgi:hypothetical protein